MKGIRLFIALFVLSLFNVSALAADGTNIGVIDLPKIISDSKKAQKVNADLRDKYASRREGIVKRQKALDTKMQNFKRDAAIMKTAKKEKLQREIANEQRDLQRLQQDFQQDLSVDQNKAMQAFLAQLRDVIEQYSKDNNVDLVVQKDAIPFASKRVDITDKIIKKLNTTS